MQSQPKDSEIDIDGRICSLPIRLLKPLCAKLSLDISVDVDGHGGDWRDLAGHIGLPVVVIELIETFRDRTKAHTLFKIWDEGISRNPGSIRKLIIALYELGISYLEGDLLVPLMGSTVVDALDDYVESLKQSLKEPIFPCLDVNDVVWDDEMEQHDQQGHMPRSDTACSTWSLPMQVQIDDRCIYVSYYTRSRSRTYTREVKNIISDLQQCNYRVGHSDIQAQKQQWMRQSANIIVVFNKEYLKAHEAFENNEMLPSCLAVDIPMISHIFNNVPGGRSRIIPVVIDRCRTQPPLRIFPVYLTGTPRKFYPKEARVLLACIQNIPLQVVRPSPGIRTIKQDIYDSDEIRRKYKQSKAASS